ncbi:helix-turn-helix domain-containing protein [Alcaligenaceae bacterium CGII-47]|nr:helix-turn-helix domain-containing protein [Alcaligenaceae bacterium CGII-47]
MSGAVPTRVDPLSIPQYSLYGQIDSAAELQFLHLETLESRNQYYNWNIRPHRHHDLHQIIWVEQGGGPVMLDDKHLELAGPVLINIPPSIVHGFQWAPGAQGFVLTMAESFMADLIGPSGERMIGTSLGRVLAMTRFRDEQASSRLAMLFSAINDEYVHEQLCRTATISGYVLILLAEIARLQQSSRRGVPAVQGGGSELYQKFKELVEAHYRARWAVAEYAATLAMTERSLRRLCQRFAKQTPVQIIHRRLLLEAKRMLLYTGKSVAAVGYDLGFEDPAYFTRFFIQHAGQTPLQFRRSRERVAA